MKENAPHKRFLVGCRSLFVRLAQHFRGFASRLMQAMSAWSVYTRRASSQHCRDAREYGHTTTAMHDMRTPRPQAVAAHPPPPPSRSLPIPLPSTPPRPTHPLYPRMQVPFFLLPAFGGVGVFVAVYVLSHKYDVRALHPPSLPPPSLSHSLSRPFLSVGLPASAEALSAVQQQQTRPNAASYFQLLAIFLCPRVYWMSHGTQRAQPYMVLLLPPTCPYT